MDWPRLGEWGGFFFLERGLRFGRWPFVVSSGSGLKLVALLSIFFAMADSHCRLVRISRVVLYYPPPVRHHSFFEAYPPPLPSLFLFFFISFYIFFIFLHSPSLYIRLYPRLHSKSFIQISSFLFSHFYYHFYHLTNHFQFIFLSLHSSPPSISFLFLSWIST